MNNNDNRQSVNNYVYNRRRNRAPVQNENNFNFSDRNNSDQESSPYHSYASENNYNSYTAGDQPSSQGTYNDFSQQNHFNQQSGQNLIPTYQGYDSPVPQSYSGGRRAVEVPISKKFKKSDGVFFICFLTPLLLMFLDMGIVSIFRIKSGIFIVLIPVLFLLSFVGIIAGFILSANIEDKRLKSVCTAEVTGHLVGYDSKIVRVHRKHGPNISYTVYAPKYEIFINNRYEIRTLDDYKKNQNFRQQVELLANPDGYEIIRRSQGTRQR